jgi:type IV pilus assembly protein PilA
VAGFVFGELVAICRGASAIKMPSNSPMYQAANKSVRRAAGFTLIEMMIVVAIIGVLASVAIPLYKDYVSKSQVTAAMSEITSAKGSLEEKIHGGLSAADVIAMSGSSATVLRLIGLSAANSSRCSSYTSTVNAAGSATIECVISGNSSVEGKTITWSRDVTNIWSCTTTVSTRIAPKACTGV